MKYTRNILVTPMLLTAFSCIGFIACGGSMKMHKPEQGIQGTFSTYGPPVQMDCQPLPTQNEKDSCRRENEKPSIVPYQGSLTLHNLSTQEKNIVELDAKGEYKVQLNPGEYEVCLATECSDPLEIRLGKFSIYGQRIPRVSADILKPQKPVSAAQTIHPR